ncbi:MAG: efflux RND transporter permease subunit [Cyanobacteria bacterium P01_F01_bin.150]
MNLIETATRWRHGTLAIFILLALLGIMSLLNLPLELQPSGDRPQISVTTPYPGAAPAEVEDLITRPIEERLEEVEAVKEMTSTSSLGLSDITLEFAWGTDIDDRLVAVLNKMQQVSDLPAEASESNVIVSNGGGASAMMWIVLKPQDGLVAEENRYRDLADEVIVPRLRRIEGTSRFLVIGGKEREVEVRVNPQALSDRDLSLSDVTSALQANNRDVRGGPMVLGRREYRVSTESRADNVAQLEDFVLRRDQNGRVFLGDVATAQIGRRFRESYFMYNDEESVGIGVVHRVGANVSAVAQGLRDSLDELQTRFDDEGQGIELEIFYDQSTYIDQSVALVKDNLLIGGLLATLVLVLFLGSMRTVAVVALSIPTTLITVFIVMGALGQTLNVISLAGLAFAVGMVVDNAIVVVENVFTHMQNGKGVMQAAIDGTQEVWGAMLASTLTTVAVFVPLMLVDGEAGELFAALGITLAVSVMISLFSALTLVPMLSGMFLDQREAQMMMEGGQYGGGNRLERWVARTSAIFRKGQGRLEALLLSAAAWSIGTGRKLRRLTMLGIATALLVGSTALLPQADYLPEGNRNLILWLTEPFPGTSVEEVADLTADARAFVREQPEVRNSFLVIQPGLRGIGFDLKDEYASSAGLNSVLGRVLPAGFRFPGFRFMFPIRIPIFSDPGKQFEVQIVGDDLQTLSALEQDVTQQIQGVDGVLNVRSDFVYGAPELKVIPDRDRLAEVGLTEAEAGAMVEAALGGRFTSKFIDGQEELDVTVELQNTFVETPDQLRQLPLYTNNGLTVQLGDVAEVVEQIGPDTINHVNIERSITLTATVAPDAPLGGTVNATETQVLDPLRPTLPAGYRLELAGSADQLAETLAQLISAFVLSLVVTYLLLMALYRSFLYPLVIMTTVPLGLTGALLSLILANAIPGVVVPLDMITGMGFVILTGIVVNNAILLVDRALQLQTEEGMAYHESLYQATGDRLRPIFMSATTSVLGMLPLALVPGSGAELYQGLGVVLTGGLAFSTLVTPTMVPALMGLLYDFFPQSSRQAKSEAVRSEVVLS